MGLEAPVTQLSDLNELWPLSTDDRSEGDDHLRAIKVALKSLLTFPSGPAQLGVIPQYVSSAAAVNVLTPGEVLCTLTVAVTGKYIVLWSARVVDPGVYGQNPSLQILLQKGVATLRTHTEQLTYAYQMDFTHFMILDLVEDDVLGITGISNPYTVMCAGNIVIVRIA